MKTKMYHAHPGPCVVPPTDDWACPYTTLTAEIEAAPRFPMVAVRFAYELLCNLSTADFQIGGDKPARQALAAAFHALGGGAIDDDFECDCHPAYRRANANA